MSTALEDELETGEAGRSVKIAKRANNERPAGRSSRGSFGSSKRFSVASQVVLREGVYLVLKPNEPRPIGTQTD